MKEYLIVMLCCWTLMSSAQQKLICISIDDLPLVSYGNSDKSLHQGITDGIVSAFQNHQAPGIGYVNEGKLYKNGFLDSSKVRYLEQWLEAGLDLGNHTFSHKNYHSVSFEEYTKDLLRGEEIIKPLAEKYGRKVEFFRHPYLRSGLRRSHADSLKLFLKETGYVEAPVTIDTDDYLFAITYSDAFKNGDTQLMKRIGNAYLDYMEKKLQYFEMASIELLGRNVKHTLLIHANLLNGNYLNALMSIYEENGYSFISQAEALKDPAYQREISRFDDWGISWIHRWALSKEMPDSFFKKDPPTPEFVRDLARNR